MPTLTNTVGYMDKPRRCRDCAWCVLEDYGYSNYATEGTSQGCLLRLNPDFPVEDSFYGKVPENEFAQKCARFKSGNPIHFDVDREEGRLTNYIEDEEVLAYWLLTMPDDQWGEIIEYLNQETDNEH